MRIHLSSKINQVALVTVAYTVVLLTFRHFDHMIFTEIGVYVEKVKSYYSGHLSNSEQYRAFHLDEKYRNDDSNVILMWSPPFGNMHPIGNMENGCVRTYDRTAIMVAKAVVFHFAEIQDDPYWLPLHQRKSSQRWIWLCLEPPTLTTTIFHKVLTPLNGIFNLTMTYRTDSDVTVTYQQNISQTNRSVDEMMQSKRSSALGIWVVSNCKSSFRNKIIEELQQYLTIDVKGKCTGDYLCTGPCALTTVSSYKFVFTLENSRCKDYITEKFFKWGLKTDAIPVVLGPSRSSYEKYASAKSFIHVSDFENIEQLAKYLLYLDKNDKAYAEYLKYKSTNYPEFSLHPPTRPNYWSTVCNMIKDGTKQESVIDNLDTWWYGNGYHTKSSKPIVSVCEKDEGTSGKDYHATFVFWYHLALLLFYATTCVIVVRAGDNAVHESKSRSRWKFAL